MTPRVGVTIQGLRRSVSLDAIIDLGFDGFFCIPMEVASWIGVEVDSWGRWQLADGSQSRVLLVRCAVEFLGKSTPVVAHVTDAADPLIGTKLLEHCRLMVDFDPGEVKLKRKRS